MKLCSRCKGEGCWSDYPGNWYVCEPCGEIGALNDDGSSINPHRWISENELVAIGMRPRDIKPPSPTSQLQPRTCRSQAP